MHIQQILAVASLLLTASGAHAVSIVSDDFNDGALDTTTWQVLIPLADSQMTEANGNAEFFQRGTLITQQGLPTANQITGRFAFTGGDHDIFVLMLRTDGTLLSPYQQFGQGVYVQFAMRGGDDGDQTGERNIYLVTDSGLNVLGITDFLFQRNAYYDFKITDDGENVQVFVEDMTNPLLSGSTTFAPGDMLGMQNRGYVPWWPTYDNEVSLDYIKVEGVGVPDTSGSLGLLGISLGILGLISIPIRSRSVR